MTTRLTPLTGSLLVILGWAVVLGVAFGRAELLLAALPVVVQLAIAARPRARPGYDVSHELSADRVFEGDRVSVTVTLTGHSGPIEIELLQPLPPDVEVIAGSTRALFLLEQRPIRWRYELRCARRRRFSLGVVHLRIWDLSGLRLLETRRVTPQPVRVYPRVTPLRGLPNPLRTQTHIGDYVARSTGEGLEPGDIRPFMPGDEVRHVNWRASLRRRTLYVTRYQQERNADILLMLDTLSEVGASPNTSLDAGVRAAASLASAFLSRKDRVGLIRYGGALQWIKPDTGRIQLERLLDALLEAEVIFTYVSKDLALVPPRVLSPSSLVIALSPLCDERFIKATSDLAARGFDVMVLAISPVGLTRGAERRSGVTDAACRLWALERRIRRNELARHGLRVIDWDPEEPLELALTRISRRRRRAAIPA
jgi:uncharacterized protein (DUF58 family)